MSMLLLLLSGCGMKTESSSGPVHIQIWSMWTGDEEREFEQVVTVFNRTHPDIVVENYSVPDDTQTISAIIAGVPPDLCTLSDPSYLGTLAANHAVLPLDSEFAGAGLKSDQYTGGSLGLCTYRGHIYALPYLLDCIALLYNKDVFKSAGLDPGRPPRTYDELLADCIRITRHDSSGHISRIGLEAVDAVTFVSSCGGEFIDRKTGLVDADNPRNIRALGLYKKLMDAQGGYESVEAFAQGFAGSTGSLNPFYTGQVGMMYSGEWNPYWAYKYSASTSYGVAPLPFPAESSLPSGTVFLSGNPICIPVGSAHPKEAWEFLRWTQSADEQDLLAEKLKNIPNIRAALHDPNLSSGAPWCPYFAQFMALADSRNAKYFPPSPAASFYVGQISNAMDSVCYDRQTPSSALSAVQRRVQHEMERYAP